MGWLWPWKDDPLSELDPSLKAFLNEQGPSQKSSAKPARAATPSPAAQQSHSSTSDDSEPSTSWRSYLGLSTENSFYTSTKPVPAPTSSDKPHDNPNTVPKESLFQDGRYADIWKTYRPSRDIEQAGKSDQERLLDIVHTYRDRQAEVRRAALENCSIQQLAVHDCFKNGSISAKMTMCRAENKELERCVVLQSRFLKALGYLDMQERPEAESEKIQMHADTLYQRMKVQEKAIFDAREKGEPLPDFAPLVRHQGEAVSADSDEYLAKPSTLRLDELPKHLQEKYSQARLDGLEGPEREVAKYELEQELSSHAQLYKSINSEQRRERRERLDRQAAGQERMSDKLRRIFDLRDWSKVDAEEAEREAQRQRAQMQQTQAT